MRNRPGEQTLSAQKLNAWLVGGECPVCEKICTLQRNGLTSISVCIHYLRAWSRMKRIYIVFDLSIKSPGDEGRNTLTEKGSTHMKKGPAQITFQYAEQVRQAFGPDSIVFETMTEEDVMEDYREYQTDKRGNGSVRDWIDQHVQAQTIHFEREREGVDFEADALETMLHEQQEFLKGITTRTRQLPEPDGGVMAKSKSGGAKAASTKAPKKSAAKDAQAPAVEQPQDIPASPQAAAPGHVELPGDDKPTAKKAAAKAKTDDGPKGPAIGQPGLSTDAELTDPRAVNDLSDFQFFLNLDEQGRVVARSFLAKVSIAGKTSSRRAVFELRNEAQAKLIKPGAWRQVPYDWYAKFTVGYFEKDGYPTWDSIKAQISPKTKAATTTEQPNA